MSNELLFLVAAVVVPPLLAGVLTFLPANHTIGLALLTFSLTFVVDVNLMAELSYRGITRSIDLSSVDLVVWGLLLFLLTQQRRRGAVWSTPTRAGTISPVVWYPALTTAFLMYFVINVVSSLGAVSAKFALFDMIKLGRGFLLFWVAANLIRDDRTERAIPVLFACFVFVETAVAIWDHYAGVWQARATFEHKNLFGFAMNMLLPFVFARLLVRRSWQLPYLVVYLAGAVAVIISRSRTAWATMAIGAGIVVVLSFLAAWRRRAGGEISRMVVILGALFVAAIPLGARLADSVISRWSEAADASMNFRVVNNRIATQLALDNPLGVGPNNYVEHLNSPIAAGLNPADRIVAHNAYLLVAAELGWFGLAVFLGLLLSFVRLACRTYRKATSLQGIYVSIGAFAAILCSMLHGLMESHGFFDSHSYFVWCLMMGVTVGAARREGVGGLSLLRRPVRRPSRSR